MNKIELKEMMVHQATVNEGSFLFIIEGWVDNQNATELQEMMKIVGDEGLVNVTILTGV